MRDAHVLYELQMAIKMIRQSRSAEIAHVRFDLLCSRVLPSIITNSTTRDGFIDYFREFWMSDDWLPAWVDFGRFIHGILSVVTTGNSVERLWIDVISHLCKGKQFKRIDDLVAALTGFTVAGETTTSPSYFRLLGYRRRDAELAEARTSAGIRHRKLRAGTDVLLRQGLGFILLLRVWPLLLPCPPLPRCCF